MKTQMSFELLAIMLLTIITGWLELPLKLVWLSSCFLLIGGGSTATGAVAMMIITNASPKKYR